MPYQSTGHKLPQTNIDSSLHAWQQASRTTSHCWGHKHRPHPQHYTNYMLQQGLQPVHRSILKRGGRGPQQLQMLCATLCLRSFWTARSQPLIAVAPPMSHTAASSWVQPTMHLMMCSVRRARYIGEAEMRRGHVQACPEDALNQTSG